MTTLFPQPLGIEDKPEFKDIPQPLIDKIERLCGARLLQGNVAYGGFSATAGFLFDMDNNEKVFAKGNHPQEMAHGTQTLRQEILVYQHVPVLSGIAPKYIGCVDDGNEDGWMLGLWQGVDTQAGVFDLDKSMQCVVQCYQPGTDTAHLKPCHSFNYIEQFFSDKKKWHRVKDEEKVRTNFLSLFKDQSAGLDWLLKHLPFFCARQAGALTLARPEGVMHGDLRPDNILQDKDGRFYIVDWPNACTGPVAFDLLTLGAGLEALGLYFIEDVVEAFIKGGGRPPLHEDLVTLAVSMSGFYADQARRASPARLPRLRWMQKSLFLALLRFLNRSGFVESIPEMV